MRVGDYVLRPDDHCWKLSTVKVWGPDSKRSGEEYEVDLVYPGTFAQALRRLLERMVRDGTPSDEELTEAVERVERAYETIGESKESVR